MKSNHTLFVGCAFALAALLMAPEPAAADTAAILGTGNRSCPAWLQDSAANSWGALIDHAWVQGYITAFNKYTDNADSQNGDISAGIDVAGLFAWIDRYCQAHPLDNLARASGALIRELQNRSARR
jgi:hypothetical protein